MILKHGGWLAKTTTGIDSNHMATKSAIQRQSSVVKDTEIGASSKCFWFRVLGIYLIALTLTISIIGTIVYLYLLPEVIGEYCNCSSDTDNIVARIQELERKLNLIDKSLPEVVDLENFDGTLNEFSIPNVFNGRSKRSMDNRFKRQIERQLINDGEPIVLNEGSSGSDGSSSQANRQNTEGLRIYDAWNQNSNSIPTSKRNGRNSGGSSGDNGPIRPHHRKSAAWVEQKSKRRKRKKHNLNAHFDENSIYRNAYPNGRPGRNRAIDLPNKNRAKQTSRPEDQLISARRSRVSVTATKSSRSTLTSNSTSISDGMAQRAMKNRAAVRSLDNRHHRTHHSGKRRNHHGHSNTRQLGIHHQVSSSSSSNSVSSSGTRSVPSSSNNVIVNERRPVLKSGGSHSGAIKDRFKGLKSVHFVGKLDRAPVDGNNRNLENDGKFRSWTTARWAKTMRLEEEFPLNNGSVKIKQPGVYYIYAQINYLDENDVNAFQVMVNEDPFLLCTVMTHTGRSHTISKANTCYTGGVKFLETDDEISIRDLEVGRHSVVRPAHTFFGLIQLSGLNE